MSQVEQWWSKENMMKAMGQQLPRPSTLLCGNSINKPMPSAYIAIAPNLGSLHDNANEAPSGSILLGVQNVSC